MAGCGLRIEEISLYADAQPSAAVGTLDKSIDVLNAETALLRQCAGSEHSHAAPAILSEASALLRAFGRAEKPDVRLHCLVFVQVPFSEGRNA